MSIIHAQTDELRSAGRTCEIAYLDFEDMFREVRSAAYRLEANWQGGSSDSFQYELTEWLKVMAQRIDQVEYFGRVLARQAEGWEEIDQRWTGVLREVRASEPGKAVRT